MTPQLKEICVDVNNTLSIALEALNNNAQGIVFIIENNVFSYTNAKSYGKSNPFLLTNFDSFLEFKKYTNFNLLLDVAHLKVSANSLGLNFENELSKLIPHSNYIHLSDNNGLHDQNKPFEYESDLISSLKNYTFNDTIFTIEIYSSLSKIKSNVQFIKDSLLKN